MLVTEAGGIHKRLGYYQIVENGKKITFLDTPEHAALYIDACARGASLPLLSSRFVAADGGVAASDLKLNGKKRPGNVVAINN